MDIEKIINVFNNGCVTTKELNNLGYNSSSINKLIKMGVIKRVERGVYDLNKINALLTFADELLKNNNLDRYLEVISQCYNINSDDYNDNVRMLSFSIMNNDKEKVYRYFDFIYKYLKEHGRENDAYYLLFMYSYIYDVPASCEDDFKKFLNSDTWIVDSDRSRIRDYVYNIRFSDVKQILSNGEFSFSNVYEQELENVLINKGYKMYFSRDGFIKKNIIQGNYSKVKNLLEKYNKRSQLSNNQSVLLELIDAYLYINLSHKVPEMSSDSDSFNIYSCISNNNFHSAKKMLDEHYDRIDGNRDDDIYYVLLSKIVKIIDSINYENEMKKKLTLDNIISMILDCDYSLVDSYLASIKKESYSFLIKNLIKLSELEKNNYFLIATLTSISTNDYRFNINYFVSLFIKSLEKKEFDRARIMLDIISSSSHISKVDLKNSMTKMFDMASSMCTDLLNNNEDEANVTSIVDVKPTSLPFPNQSKLSNPFENKVRRLIDSLSEDNPFVLLPPVSSEDEMDIIFNVIDSVPNVVGFAINTIDGVQTVARYNVEIDKPIDFKDELQTAIRESREGNYVESINRFKYILSRGKPSPYVFGSYGITLRNAGKIDKAIEALTIATYYAKLLNRDLDYSSVILDLTHYRYKDSEYEKKPSVDLSDFNPDDSSFGRQLPFLSDLIELVKNGEFDFDESLEKLGLSEIDKNYARLVYARDCYFVGSMDIGNRYLEMVERSSDKNSDIIKLLDEVRKNKRFYQNRLDEERTCLVLLK